MRRTGLAGAASAMDARAANLAQAAGRLEKDAEVAGEASKTAGIPSGGGLPGKPSGMPMGGMPNGIDMQAMLAKMQAMMQGPPLSPAEFDDLVTKLERRGKVSDAVKPGSACSAEDYRRLFGRMTVASRDPRASQMTAGMMRMIYSTFRDVERKFAQSAELFAQMSPADRAEYVDALTAELKSGPPENRRAFLAMLDNGLMQPPQDMMTAFHQRLAD